LESAKCAGCGAHIRNRGCRLNQAAVAVSPDPISVLYHSSLHSCDCGTRQCCTVGQPTSHAGPALLQSMKFKKLTFLANGMLLQKLTRVESI
jgi:hypothetical protein